MNTATASSPEILPFRIDIPQADVEDLADRLARTRLPQPAPGDEWASGPPPPSLAPGDGEPPDPLPRDEQQPRVRRRGVPRVPSPR